MATTETPSTDLAEAPAKQLEADIVELSSQLASGTYRLLVLVGELEARGSWATWGALSCAAWLAEACDLDIATARTQVRVARALSAYSRLAEAMAAKRISYAKARVLVPVLASDNEAALVELAERIPAGRLGAAIAEWSRRNEDPETIDERHRRERRLSWRTDPDGMVTFTHRLPPHRAGVVIAAIDQRVMSDRAPAGASLAQQRSDAAMALITGGGAATVTEVVIHVDETGSHLPDGTPVSGHAVAGLLDDAFLSLLIHDTDRRPIDASPRRRHPTRRQRRVLEARQQTCAVEGCTARTLLQADHIHPSTKGGPTILDNLQLLCGHHNREKGTGPPGGERPDRRRRASEG